MRKFVFIGLILSLFGNAQADDVDVVAAEFIHSGNSWTVNVTLRHGDTGWDHYADAWRVVSAEGKVFGTRVLYHPHSEQPFTRSLPGIEIPAGIKLVFIEGHDKVHGWSPNRLKIDLTRDQGEGYRIIR